MSFTFRPATRDRVSLLVALAGASGSGKTYSALLLARGLANGVGKIAVIDTEAGRAKHYADRFDFLHGDFDPPFTPERYVEAIRAAEDAGATVVVIDSMSHEWNGEGGLSDMAATEAERIAKAWKTSPDAVTAQSWGKPKVRHKRMMSRLLQTRAHVIYCLRAEEKIKFVEEIRDGRRRQVPVPAGFLPICEKGFMFEMSMSLTLHPETPGQVRYDLPHKLNNDLRGIFADGQCITLDAGKLLRNWAEAGEDIRPSPEDQRILDGVRETIATIEDADHEALQAITSGEAFKKRAAWLKANRPTLAAQVDAALSAALDRTAAPVADDGWRGPDVGDAT